MKVLFTGDWQAKAQNLDRCEAAQKFLLQCIEKYKVRSVGLLGDMKEVMNPVDQRVTNFLISLGMSLFRASNTGCHFALEGNHDRVAIADGSETGLAVLAAAGVYRTVERFPELVQVFNDGEPPLRIWAVPFYRDLKYAAAMVEQGIGKADVLVFHNEVAGGRNNLLNSSPIGLDPALLSQFKVAVGGHIHLQQEVAPSVWFVGSPFCQDWSEANQKKGFLLLDTKTWKVTSIPTPFPGWYDPALPGARPTQWEGVRVRVRIPHGAKAAQNARNAAEKAYPGAVLHYETQRGEVATNVALENASDSQLIKQYLRENPIWGNVGQLTEYLAYKMEDLGTGLRGLRGGKFKSTEGRNVLCYEAIQLSFTQPGTTLVTGSNLDWPGRNNGAGKSSAFALPLIAWFGRTTKEQKHDGWARQGTKETAVAGGVFELADGRELKVKRTRRPSAIEAWIDDKPIGAGDARAVQKAIQDYTGLSWEVLTSALYVGQNEASTLLLGTDKERKELFSQFLGLQRFQIATERISVDLKRTRASLLEIEESLITLQHLVEAQHAQVEQDKRLRAEREQRIKRFDELGKQKSLLEKQLSGMQQKRDSVNDKLERLQQSERIADRALNSAVDQEKRLRANIASLTTDRKCPTCGTVLKKGESAAHLEKELHKITASRAVLFETDGKAKLVLRKAEKDAAEVLGQFQEVRNKLASVNGALGGTHVGPEIESHVVDGVREKQEFIKACNLYVEKLTSDIQFYQAALKVVSRNGLPAFLCSLACPQLNEAAREFSEAFAESGIAVEFLGSEGEVDVRVENPHGGEGVEDQSQGEMRLAAIIASFAMRAVLAPYNLLILDEPGEGLDSYNATIFAKGLNKIAHRFGSVFVTSHNPAILSALEPDRHLEAVKENGIATLKVLA